MSSPSEAQIDALFNFLEEHRDLARGNLRSIEGRTLSHRLWEELCTMLNSMGGCTKTTKQWQKVWTDKKYLAKKAAVAARRSASATGGGPSTAPSLSQWELKVISIMGEGFGEPQTSARVPAFVENSSQESSSAALSASAQPDQVVIDHSQLSDHLQVEALPSERDTHGQLSQQDTATIASDASITRHQISTSRQRRFRRHSATSQANSSVRDRFFGIEERRMLCEEQRNVELAGIRMAVVELCNKIQQLSEEVLARRNL